MGEHPSNCFFTLICYIVINTPGEAMDYNSFIENRKTNQPLKNYEIHHIIPRCMGGSDDEYNLIKLSYRDHYLAHYYLAKEYPEVKGLRFAYVLMSNRKGGHFCVPPTEEELVEYEECKKVISETLKNRKVSKKTREKIMLSHWPKNEMIRKRIRK